MRWALFFMIAAAVVRLHAAADSLRPPTVTHTVDVIESAVRDLTDSVIARSGITPGDSVPLYIHDHPDASWIRSIVARRMEERGMPVIIAEGLSQAQLEMTVMDVSTRYAPMPDPDSLHRQIVVKLGSSFKRVALALESHTESRTISRPDARATQSVQHTATHAALPEAPSSVWEDALEPLIYIAAAVVTIVLFFTVRTQ